VVSSLSVPATAGAGQDYHTIETTRNQGGGAAGASVTAYFLSSNNTLDASEHANRGRDIRPGRRSEQFGDYDSHVPAETTAGTWYVIARADRDGVLVETNESNNTYSRSIQIGPDLVVSAFTAPATAGPGKSSRCRTRRETREGASLRRR